jgi:hypothetical protein
MKTTESFEAPLSNYYGTVTFEKENDKFYMLLDNWNEPSKVEINEPLYNAAKALFVKQN